MIRYQVDVDTVHLYLYQEEPPAELISTTLHPHRLYHNQKGHTNIIGIFSLARSATRFCLVLAHFMCS